MLFSSILILIVVYALPSLNKNIPQNIFPRISSILFIYAGALSFNALFIQSIGSGIGIYSGLFHVTFNSLLLETFIYIIGSLILISFTSKLINYFLKFDYRTGEIYVKEYISEYSVLVLFTSLGASLLVSSADIFSMYLSIELQSFGIYILTTLHKNSELATSAGLKYFLLGGLSSCIILLGTGLIYTYTGLTSFESIYSVVSVSDGSNISQGLSLGIILLFIGFLFKVAAAPLHNWAPDVYDNSPTIVTVWLTIMPKISILIFLLELQTQIGVNLINLDNLISSDQGLLLYDNNLILNNLINENTLNVLRHLLLISSLLSLIIGTVVGLAQLKIKRLLAYSTISHIGFILLALAINSEQSVESLIFYIIQYSITNLNTFLILLILGYIIYNYNNNDKINLVKKGKELISDLRDIAELIGQFFINPLLSLSLIISLFSMAGIPPLIGFFSKQFVLYSAIQSGYYFISILAIVVSVISASYYLRFIRILLTENIKDNQNSQIFNYLQKVNFLVVGYSSSHCFVISTLTFSIYFLFSNHL